jgi:CAAX protease family protein
MATDGTCQSLPTRRSRDTLAGWARVHPCLAFFVLAFALTWIVWLPLVLSQDGLGLVPTHLSPFQFDAIQGAGAWCGPAFSALLVAAVTEGWRGVGGIFTWRASQRRAVVAAVFAFTPLVVLLLLLSPTMLAIVARQVRVQATSGLMLPLYLSNVLLNVVPGWGTPLPEEIGWRGFALPRLQRRYGPVAAALILGILWWLWHAPLFLVARWSGGASFAGFLLAAIPIVLNSIFLTFLYDLAGENLWIAVFYHASYDVAGVCLNRGVIFFRTDPPLAANYSLLYAGIAGTLALLLILLTRGRLAWAGQEFRQIRR